LNYDDLHNNYEAIRVNISCSSYLTEP